MANKKILYISSADPLNGPGTIALDHVKAIREAGYDVDFLTKYPVAGHKDILYVLDAQPSEMSWLRRWKTRFSKLIRFEVSIREVLYKRRFYKIRSNLDTSMGCASLFYAREDEPPVRINKVIEAIPSTDYDVIAVYFWQELLSYDTIDAICKNNIRMPKLVYLCADYSTMTGGCHFFGKCDRYVVGCGNCPLIRSTRINDFTRYNMIKRREINDRWKPIVMCNSYMKSFFEKSYAMYHASYVPGRTILDLDLFHPTDKKTARSELKIPKNKDFVVFYGAQNIDDPRKGFDYFRKSIDKLYDLAGDDFRKRTIILLGGRNSEIVSKVLPFDCISLGYLSVAELPMVYSAATVFVSPSINDPGPSMVNQAIACGTPVVAFEIGVALDVVKRLGAGICVPLFDTNAFANAIYNILTRSCEKDYNLDKIARKVAEKEHSIEAFACGFSKAVN